LSYFGSKYIHIPLQDNIKCFNLQYDIITTGFEARIIYTIVNLPYQ